MKITIVSGSHRAVSESERVARYMEAQLTKKGIDASVLSLARNPLPLWDETVWTGAPEWVEKWAPLAKKLQASDGFVVISPEWSGMVPPGLKNFFLLCSSKEVGHKPALIVGVSSGVGGSYPVSELRSSSYKNTRIVFIPDHVIIREVGEMLHGDEATSQHDAAIRGRLGYSLEILVEYTKALTGVRNSGKVNIKDFPYGM